MTEGATMQDSQELGEEKYKEGEATEVYDLGQSLAEVNKASSN